MSDACNCCIKVRPLAADSMKRWPSLDVMVSVRHVHCGALEECCTARVLHCKSVVLQGRCTAGVLHCKSAALKECCTERVIDSLQEAESRFDV